MRGFFLLYMISCTTKQILTTAVFLQLASFIDRIHRQGTSSLTRPMLRGRRTFPAKNPCDQSVLSERASKNAREFRDAQASQTSWSSCSSFLQKLFFHHFIPRKEILEKILHVSLWQVNFFFLTQSSTLTWIFEAKSESISLAVQVWLLRRRSTFSSLQFPLSEIFM